MDGGPRDSWAVMPMDTPWMEQELLAHAAWVRELARGLVRDEASAEDLAQDTLLVALRGAPREQASMRAWLAGIARRLAWNQHRARERARSLSADEWEQASTTSPQSIERLELYEQLAKELRELREPLRATLVERYVHSRSAAEIARRSGVPLPTVRSRLQQGLEELRIRLDRRYGGQRETWMSALTLAAGSKGAVLGGSVVVSTLAKVSAGLAVLVLGVMFVSPLLERGGVPGHAQPAPGPSAGATLASSPRGVVSETQASGARAAEPRTSVVKEAIPDPLRVLVTGRCVDLEGRPVADAVVALTEVTWTKRLLPGDPRAAEFLTRTRSASDGCFTITTRLPEPDDGVLVAVEARRPGYCRGYLRTGGKFTGELELGDIKLGPGTRVAGVVRDVLGKPCAGVLLRLSSKKTAKAPAVRDEARSDRDGSFVFESAPAAPFTLVASADDLRSARLEVDLNSGDPRVDLELVLPELNGNDSISGTVVDPQGRAVPKAHLEAEQTGGQDLRLDPRTTCDEHGRFRIDCRSDCAFQFTAYDPDGVWGGVRVNEVRSGTHGILLQLDGSRAFLLRVHDASGAPIEGFRWERGTGEWIWQDSGNAGVHPQGELRISSDVVPFYLRITAPGWCTSTLGPLDPAKMAEVIDAVLERACVIRGVVRSGGKPIRASVRLVDSRFESVPKPTPLGWTSPPVASSGEDGLFELSVEGSGTVRLQAERFAFADLSPISEPVTVHPGGIVAGLVLEIRPCGSVEGNVIRMDGAPGAGLIVSARREGRLISFTDTDAGGSFRIPGLSEGTYELVVAAHHLGREHETGSQPGAADPQHWPCEIRFGQVTRCDLHLLETTRLRVVLELPRPPRENWVVELWQDLPGSVPIKSASTPTRNLDELDFRESLGKETLEFEFIEPLEGALRIESGGALGPMRMETSRQSFARGTHELKCSLSAGRLEGTLGVPFAPTERITLSLQSGSFSVTVESRADAAGRFVFDCAPAGECRIERVGVAGSARTVAVKAGETSQLDGL